MRKINTGSLPESLKEILASLETIDSSIIESAYGTDDDILVLVSRNEELDGNFINPIGHEVGEEMEERNEDIGFIISDGPDRNSNQIAAYVREDPEDTREYIIPFCDRLSLDRSTMAEISEKADKEKDNSKPKKTAATLIAEHQLNDPEGVSVGDISKETGVKISTLRNLIMKRSD